VKQPQALKILASPIALSRHVLLLQIPLALALGFGTRSTDLRQNPFLVVCFATMFIAGASICFALGNWALGKSQLLRQHSATVAFSIWLLTGFQCVALSQIAQLVATHTTPHFNQTGPIPLSTRLLFIPLMWVASLLSTSHVFQSRYEYVSKFVELRETHSALTTSEESSQQSLYDERQRLIATVSQTIKPELKSISAEIRALETQSPELPLGRILEQIDNYSLSTLRRLIAELNSDNETQVRQHPPTAIPEFRIRNVPLDPLRSIQIAAGVGAALLLPIVGVHTVLLWLIQVLFIFAPVFGLNVLRRYIHFKSMPEVTWVVLGVVVIVLMRFYGVSVLPQVQAATEHRFLPFISGGLFGLSIVLGSLDRYFLTAYAEASDEQAAANLQLSRNLNQIDHARQNTRQDLARFLHGPIQGRIAAVRMKLHLLTEADQASKPALSQEDINQLADMVEFITSEIEILAEPDQEITAIKPLSALTQLAENWSGLIDVTLDAGSEVFAVLEEDSYLAAKIVATCSEAITNASRHGHAKRVNIVLRLVDEASTLRITVHDDGRGVHGTVVPNIGLKDITADGGTWSFTPSDSGAIFCVDFALNGSTDAARALSVARQSWN
jgi:signal transduction histidine kinase